MMVPRRVVFGQPQGWGWLDQLYSGDEKTPPVLGELHVGDGRQWVYWQVESEASDGVVRWADAQNIRCFTTVTSACDALRWAAPGGTYRLVRFDGTPLITVRRHPTRRQWYVRRWE